MPQRFKVIALTVAAVFICYIDRINISVAAVEIQDQFGWDNTQLGLVFSSFFTGYIFTHYLGCFLADRYGGKRVLGYGVLLWSFFTILTPAAAHHSFFFLIIVRVLMGLGEGITFPAWHSLYARWIPYQERTRAIAFTNSGIPLGSIFAYIMTPIIMIMLGWEWAFYSFGALGVVWFFFWHRNITSLPTDHPDIAQKELDFILAEAPAKEKAPKLPAFKKLIKNNRCVAVSDGFYGWKREENEKTPHYFTRKDGKPIFFAGIYEEDQFCLITEEAKENICEIHNRQPVIINQTDINRYLNLELQGSAFLKECNKPDLIFYEVSKDVNKPTNNSASLIQKIN